MEKQILSLLESIIEESKQDLDIIFDHGQENNELFNLVTSDIPQAQIKEAFVEYVLGDNSNQNAKSDSIELVLAS
jgi:hypothetical protein